MTEQEFIKQFLSDVGSDDLLCFQPLPTTQPLREIDKISKLTNTNIFIYRDIKEIIKSIKEKKPKRVLILSHQCNKIHALERFCMDIPDLRVFFISNAPCLYKNKRLTEKFVYVGLGNKINSVYLTGSVIQSISLNNNLETKKSSVHGFGIFSKIQLEKNTVLFKLYGDIINKNKYPYKNLQGEWNALSADVFLYRKYRTTYGLINHSRNPNCYIDRKKLTVIAKTNIPKNHELFLDYRKEPLPLEYIQIRGHLFL